MKLRSYSSPGFSIKHDQTPGAWHVYCLQSHSLHSFLPGVSSFWSLGVHHFLIFFLCYHWHRNQVVSYFIVQSHDRVYQCGPKIHALWALISPVTHWGCNTGKAAYLPRLWNQRNGNSSCLTGVLWEVNELMLQAFIIGPATQYYDSVIALYMKRMSTFLWVSASQISLRWKT